MGGNTAPMISMVFLFVVIRFKSYGPLATFNDDVYRSLDLVGRVIGTQQRAEEVISYARWCME